jgi:hypothetical protein
MYIIPDLAQFCLDPRMSPSFKRSSEVNPDDFAKHTGINAFKVRRGW